ncbi:venom acid phosphatase Acph-1-like [Belonocnema kinseyi]|uniref:venom acid phosphatase Acph-1-like n=1 Tax=Belonocnema kinseyi TaxID=2817044 RepID=UPI00143E014A|nr:venom acid phosphatase Acph-1-like [Belonocnema kinseyi]
MGRTYSERAVLTETTRTAPSRPRIHCVTRASSHLAGGRLIARHGDRTPNEKTEGYPNDPYTNQIFDGKLTKRGRKRELALGNFLRTKYNAFLGPSYIPGSIDARSTDLNRTKESLDLILKGLMPHAVVPTKFDSKLQDVMLVPYMCPGYTIEYWAAKRNTRKEFKKLKRFRKHLSKWTGKKIKSSLDIYRIYTTLECEKFMNLKLPSWTEGVYPDGDLLKGTLLEFDRMNHSQSMRRRNGGRLIKKCKEDMDSVVHGFMDKNRKIIIYGAHDLNIVAVLKSLGVFFPHVPKFSSAVILELYHMDKPHKHYYVKVNYYLGIPPVMKTLQIPNCEILCQLDLFNTLMEDVMPHSEYVICDEGRKALHAIGKVASAFGQSVKNVFSK